MRVERNKKARRTTGPIDLSSPLLAGPGAGNKTVDLGRAGGSGRVAGREDIVRVRLRLLLTALGELPAQRPAVPPDWRPALRRFLDGRCPPGTLVLHGRSLPNRPLVVEHLVVAPRGLVVVGPSFGQVLHGGYNHPAPTWRARESAARPNIALAVGTARAGDRRPALVRETLRRCYALRSWLAAGPWDGVPVLAAVCGCPAARASAQPWLMIDGLWLGTADQLPDWLVSEEFLDLPTRVELYRSLAEQMPIA
jgi:hypothetical protein